MWEETCNSNPKLHVWFVWLGFFVHLPWLLKLDLTCLSGERILSARTECRVSERGRLGARGPMDSLATDEMHYCPFPNDSKWRILKSCGKRQRMWEETFRSERGKNHLCLSQTAHDIGGLFESPHRIQIKFWSKLLTQVGIVLSSCLFPIVADSQCSFSSDTIS